MLYGKIKAVAKEKKIPIYKIEEDCQFAQGSICRWNESSPSAHRLKAVADYLGTTVDELLKDGD